MSATSFKLKRHLTGAVRLAWLELLAKKQQSKSSAKRSPSKVGFVVVTRCVHFSAAHRLHNPLKSKAWNEEVFGICNSPLLHGHNYELEISVAAQPDRDTGYVVEFGELKRIAHERIVEKCDHRNLNEEVDFLQGIMPSTENLAVAFWNELEPHMPKGAQLYRVRVRETPRNFADYYGPNFSPMIS